MKQLIFCITILLIVIGTKSFAQNTYSFKYDKAGNCTTRYVLVAEIEGIKLNESSQLKKGEGEAKEGFSGDIRIFPNPVSSALSIEVKDDTYDNIIVEILSYDGKLIYKENYIGETLLIDMEGYQPSTYLLRLSANNQSIIRKIVKN